MLHNSRIILGFNGVLMIIQGICFILLSNKITVYMFPSVINNPEALSVGSTLRVLMGAGSIFIGLVLFIARKSIKSAAQRLLFSSGLGFFIIFFTLLYILFSGRGNTPIFIIIIYLLLASLSLFVSTRRFQE